LNNDLISRLSQEEYLKILRAELVPKEESKDKKNLLQHFLEGVSKGAKKK